MFRIVYKEPDGTRHIEEKKYDTAFEAYEVAQELAQALRQKLKQEHTEAHEEIWVCEKPKTQIRVEVNHQQNYYYLIEEV